VPEQGVAPDSGTIAAVYRTGLLSTWRRAVDPKTEQKLIQAAQRGDEQAFGELYNAYVHDIYRYIFYRVGHAELAQDLTAEVFLRAVEGLVRFQDRQVPLLAWLYRIAHARVVDHYRHAQRVGQEDDIESVDLTVDEDLDSDLMITYQQQQIRAAIYKLPTDQQQVIVLRFIEGYNIQQTADALGKTPGAVKMIQRRALQAMNMELSRQGFNVDKK
jgi:RNA polymerase sigma-70 factor, ECF subfamily